MDLNFAFEFMIKLSACELRVKEPTEEDLAKIVRHPIYLVLDNILDTYNVGAIFRTADAAGVSKIYLCGITPTPSVGSSKLETLNSKQTPSFKFKVQNVLDFRFKVLNLFRV